jgi:hypothetical protein
MTSQIDPLIALGVVLATATTDAAYVFFNAAVVAGHRVRAANWSVICYLLSAFGVISYTEHGLCCLRGPRVLVGAFVSITWLARGSHESMRFRGADCEASPEKAVIETQALAEAAETRLEATSLLHTSLCSPKG